MGSRPVWLLPRPALKTQKCPLPASGLAGTKKTWYENFGRLRRAKFCAPVSRGNLVGQPLGRQPHQGLGQEAIKLSHDQFHGLAVQLTDQPGPDHVLVEGTLRPEALGQEWDLSKQLGLGLAKPGAILFDREQGHPSLSSNPLRLRRDCRG